VAVTEMGNAYVWGQGFRNEKIHKPMHLFQDKNGILDLQFGLRHGLYIQEGTYQVHSWGDGTVG